MNDNPYAPRAWFSARQRVVVLTFEMPEAAQAWDDAGQPVDFSATTIKPLSMQAVA